MLDKSVTYASLRMCRCAGTPIPDFPLPPGYRFVMYRDGDELSWARIETSVLEFDSEFEALMYFKNKYYPNKMQLEQRCIFAETEDGYKVATATAWWSDVKNNRGTWPPAQWFKPRTSTRRPWLHWVGVDPAHQGQGLGKAITAHAVKVLVEEEGDSDMFLSTQTWSYKAIDIYKKCGFVPTDEKLLYEKGHKNDYAKALKILEQIPR